MDMEIPNEAPRGSQRGTALPSEWLGQAAERIMRPYVDLLADRIDAASAGLRAAAKRIAEDEPDAVADRLRQTADRADALAASARQDDVDQIIDHAADFARERPGLFLGATAAAGWALGLALQSQLAARSGPSDETASLDERAHSHEAKEHANR